MSFPRGKRLSGRASIQKKSDSKYWIHWKGKPGKSTTITTGEMEKIAELVEGELK